MQWKRKLVQEIGGWGGGGGGGEGGSKITEKYYPRKKENWFEISRVSRNRGFAKSVFYCNFNIVWFI